MDRTTTDLLEVDTLINGEKWFRLKEKENYAKNKADGYYSYLGSGKKELFIYKYSAIKGETNKSPVYIYNTEADESVRTKEGLRIVEIVSTNALLQFQEKCLSSAYITECRQPINPINVFIQTSNTSYLEWGKC